MFKQTIERKWQAKVEYVQRVGDSCEQCGETDMRVIGVRRRNGIKPMNHKEAMANVENCIILCSHCSLRRWWDTSFAKAKEPKYAHAGKGVRSAQRDVYDGLIGFLIDGPKPLVEVVRIMAEGFNISSKTAYTMVDKGVRAGKLEKTKSGSGVHNEKMVGLKTVSFFPK